MCSGKDCPGNSTNSGKGKSGNSRTEIDDEVIFAKLGTS